MTYVGFVTSLCRRFKLRSSTKDQFWRLIFICGAKSPTQSDLDTRLLTKLDQEPSTTPQHLIGKCEHLVSLKNDAAVIRQSDRPPQAVNKFLTHKQVPSK
ncbi:unnamed protein product [Fasciola hepatica]|uniref:Uncharacterized protein n=1 Tax=Fasciola hepatica TaxID=6192 RepID=A0ABC9HI99_FASHE|nr:unnamed protein product [Fasciola hepatica]